MSRKSNRNANALAGMAAEALTMDKPKQLQSPQNDHTRSEYTRKNSAESASISQGSIHSSGSSLTRGSSTAESAIGSVEDGGSADSDDTDEEDGNNSDEEAVIAPSGHVIHAQAGRFLLEGDIVDTVTLPDQRPSNLDCTSNPINGIIASQDDDDDDIYNNVDLISESDGEDPDIEQQEEANIINDITDDMFPNNDLGDFSIFAEGSLFPGDVPYFDEQIRQISYSIRADDVQSYSSTNAFFRPLPSPPPPTPTTATRRVRFDASAFKSPSSTLEDKDIVLPSDLHLDYEDDSSSSGLSGYETDGETTDEDEVPITATKSPRDLLHQPSWSEEPLISPAPACRNGNVRSPKLKIRCGPRLGSWIVNSNKALGQTNDKYEVIVVEAPPRRAPTETASNRSRTSSVTACLKGHPIPRSRKKRKAIRRPLNEPIDLPDPTLGTDTNAAMAGLMENITGEEGNALQSQQLLSDFLPADDVLDEIDFAAANSDHESTDLDIMDFIDFTDDSSDSANEAKCLKLRSKDPDEVMDGMDCPTEIIAPLMTPTPSQSQPSPSSADGQLKGYDIGLNNSFRRGIPPSQNRPPLRRPRSGLALTKPTTRSSNSHTISPPVRHDRKRKLSDSYGSSSLRPTTRLRR